MGLIVKSAVLLLAAGMICPAVVNAQEQAQNQTEKGSLNAPAKAGSVQSGKPAAGSFSSGKPAAGSLTMGKPAAGSLSSGHPVAGSISSGVVGGSLSPAAGSTESVSGATRRRLESVDDGSSYTRKARKPRVRHFN